MDLDGRRLYTTNEVCAYTGYSLKTLYRAILAGELRVKRHGRRASYRVLGADITAWLSRAGS